VHPPRFRPGTYSGSSSEIGLRNSYCTASSPPLLKRHAHANTCVRRELTQYAVEL
ncbi:hypothetical protein BDQ94DRAFT_155528, partial [Aspergillus welwitschiae]